MKYNPHVTHCLPLDFLFIYYNQQYEHPLLFHPIPHLHLYTKMLLEKCLN